MPLGAAVKEEQIENKLASIQVDWAGINLVFAEYKTRGPVILKARWCNLRTKGIPCRYMGGYMYTKRSVTSRPKPGNTL
jgi:hypothetical protein